MSFLTPVPYSRQVKLYYPNKVLAVDVGSITETELWPFDDAGGDRWWSGGSTPVAFRWEVEITINNPQLHGSNLTREPFEYNGLDVVVGDWIAGATDGKVMRILEISRKTETSLTCILEDYQRYNTFASPTGNGIFNPGSAVIFSLNEDGIPMLDPLPSSVGREFFILLASRFQYLNPQTNYQLTQENHGLEVGDVVSVISTGYVKSNAITADTMIGVVTENGPGPNNFMILPNNRIYDFDPAIPGRQGDYIYVDDNGNLSNVAETSRKAVFLNLRDPIPTVLAGDVPEPTVTNGTVLTINGANVTFNGSTGGVANVDEMAAQISAVFADSDVIGEAFPFPTVITTATATLFYGQVGSPTPPFDITLDNGSGPQTVTFTSTGSTIPGVATAPDIVADFEAANIPNIEVVLLPDQENFEIRELNGNSIIIVNGDRDGTNVPFAGTGGGFGSITGLPTTTVGLNQRVLNLRRDNGGEILLREDSNVFSGSTGLFSGHTGSLPLAMNIEQGVRTGGIYVVADVTERDGLAAIVGDQAHVLDAGFGRWAQYQFDALNNWIEIANENSAATHARSFRTALTIADDGTNDLANISVGRRIQAVLVDVTTPFDTQATLTVGIGGNTQELATAGQSDLTRTGTYEITPDYFAPGEGVINITLNTNAATTGDVAVTVTYV
jgi:hypothetical protein